jgi:hypothetical protein
MSKFFGILAAVVVFLIWHSLIGNPHVIETIIGLILAGIVLEFGYILKLKRGDPEYQLSFQSNEI